MITIILALYVGTLAGSKIGILITGFIEPKGLWKLVPFRVGGWKSQLTGKLHKTNWVWE